MDPQRASYGVENLLYAVVQLAQSAMRKCVRSRRANGTLAALTRRRPCCVRRSELGKISLDKTFEEREALNASIVRVATHAHSSSARARCFAVDALSPLLPFSPCPLGARDQ